ncbi:MAG: ketoacyl-ACP synthase III [Desulfovibrio sp.]|nr:ketoacyl-ACP synthase III [Desulfovibrio sp.]
MPYLEFLNISIAALAGCTPTPVQTLEAVKLSIPDKVIAFQKLTGVKERHISLSRQTAVDLGCSAAKRAMDSIGWGPESLDGIIFLSQTPDFNAGTGNSFLAHYILGLRNNAFAFDIPLACSSFPYGLSVAASLLQQQHIRRLLVISGDSQWHFYPDGNPVAYPNSAFMFGESATALLLERDENAKPIIISLNTDGSGYKYLYNPLGGVRNAWISMKNILLPNGDIFTSSGKFGYMDGIEIMNFSITTVVDSIREFLQTHAVSFDDYDGLVLHQANLKIVKTIAKRLGVGLEKVPLSLDHYGNTSGASTPFTMVTAYAGQDREELALLCCAFGTGLSWGIASLTVRPKCIVPVFCSDDRFVEADAKPAPQP